jgi:hypothetical protein
VLRNSVGHVGMSQLHEDRTAGPKEVCGFGARSPREALWAVNPGDLRDSRLVQTEAKLT